MLYATTAAAVADDLSESSARGQALAQRLCAVCHMNPGQGEKQGARGVPGFAAIAARPDQTHEGIVAWLASAPPMMPNHKLTQDERQRLADFIVTLKPAN